MNDSNVQLVEKAIPLWHANIAWAKALLASSIKLSAPQDVLRKENRHLRQVPDTCWFVQPHGIGVHIHEAPGVDGIDFDFDKDDPDEWRLARFIDVQVDDGQLPYAAYRELLGGEQACESAIASARHRG